MRLAVEEAAAGAGGADGLQHQRDDQPCLLYLHAIYLVALQALDLPALRRQVAAAKAIMDGKVEVATAKQVPRDVVVVVGVVVAVPTAYSFYRAYGAVMCARAASAVKCRSLCVRSRSRSSRSRC